MRRPSTVWGWRATVGKVRPKPPTGRLSGTGKRLTRGTPEHSTRLAWGICAAKGWRWIRTRERFGCKRLPLKDIPKHSLFLDRYIAKAKGLRGTSDRPPSGFAMPETKGMPKRE